MAKDLEEINNEIKSIINESKFISIKLRNKIIKKLGQEFDIEFPTENYELHGVIVFWPIIFIILSIVLITRSFIGLKNIFIHLSHL